MTDEDRWLYAPAHRSAVEGLALGAYTVDALLYGREGPDLSLYSPDERLDFWVHEWLDRLHNDRDVVCIVHGPAGCGKSTLILHIFRRMDEVAHPDPTTREFTPETLKDRVAFKAHQVGEFYERTPRYGAFFIDEAATAALMATGTFDPDQKDLVELINVVRALNIALFIALPSIDELAKSFRARRADYRIEIPDLPDGGINRGFVGRKARGRKFFMDDGSWLGFSDDPSMNPIEWSEYARSGDAFARALWDAYLPLKHENVRTTGRDITSRMIARESRRQARREEQDAA